MSGFWQAGYSGYMALAWIDDNWIKRADDGTELGRTLQRKLSAARKNTGSG